MNRMISSELFLSESQTFSTIVLYLVTGDLYVDSNITEAEFVWCTGVDSKTVFTIQLFSRPNSVIYIVQKLVV